MIERYKSFPPRIGHLKIPTTSKKGARAALVLYSPCRWKGVLVRRVAWHLIGLVGPGALPGRARPWKQPLSQDDWHELMAAWAQAVPEPEQIAIYQRRQRSRSGFGVLLIRGGNPSAFVKIRRGLEASALENEFHFLTVAEHARPRTFATPTPLAFGKEGEWQYLVTSSLPVNLHHMPRRPPILDIVREIAAVFQSIPRPSAVPAHWVPMHGDFTPWNLREGRSRRLHLFDWEEAGWGPPGADSVLYEAVVSALRNKEPSFEPYDEARSFWLRRMRVRAAKARATGDQDAALAEKLVELMRTQ